MSKIIVAGMGHGGIVAAAKMAKAGFDVTVVERNAKNTLGHDWEDRFTFELLLKATELNSLPEGSWRNRGDCTFVSPSHNTHVNIKYTEKTRQKIMWRKPLINTLIDYAESVGVKIDYETEVLAPIVEKNAIVGIKTNKGDYFADLTVDALGVFSTLRQALPDSFGIQKSPARGDVFYAYRAYYNKTKASAPEFPFEVYLYHECEQGLSWCCTNSDNVDILIGRIDPLTSEKVEEQVDIFRESHPYIGKEILHGGAYGVIPVRRPLPLMVADGYAAVGDSAFMTTPMNGMGIDLSINAGLLLADTVINNPDFSAKNLWKYNRQFHILFGGDTAKNEGLKNSLLELPPEGVDFLFDNAVIQSSDLSGAGKNTKLSSLLGKFIRGMRKPTYFFAIIKGLIKGAKVCRLYKTPPIVFDRDAINDWSKKIDDAVVRITRVI
jgi:Dehydrogenases (flavoproteins)